MRDQDNVMLGDLYSQNLLNESYYRDDMPDSYSDGDEYDSPATEPENPFNVTIQDEIEYGPEKQYAISVDVALEWYDQGNQRVVDDCKFSNCIIWDLVNNNHLTAETVGQEKFDAVSAEGKRLAREYAGRALSEWESDESDEEDSDEEENRAFVAREVRALRRQR